MVQAPQIGSKMVVLDRQVLLSITLCQIRVLHNKHVQRDCGRVVQQLAIPKLVGGAKMARLKLVA